MVLLVAFLVLFSCYVGLSTIPDATKISYFVVILVFVVLYTLLKVI